MWGKNGRLFYVAPENTKPATRDCFCLCSSAVTNKVREDCKLLRARWNAGRFNLHCLWLVHAVWEIQKTARLFPPSLWNFFIEPANKVNHGLHNVEILTCPDLPLTFPKRINVFTWLLFFGLKHVLCFFLSFFRVLWKTIVESRPVCRQELNLSVLIIWCSNPKRQLTPQKNCLNK